MGLPTAMGRTSLILASMILVSGACSGTPAGSVEGSGSGPTACEAAFDAAAAIDDMHDSVEDLDPAVRACSTVDAWVSAAAKYPTALNEGVDAREYLANRCLYGAGLAVTPLCKVATPS